MAGSRPVRAGGRPAARRLGYRAARTARRASALATALAAAAWAVAAPQGFLAAGRPPARAARAAAAAVALRARGGEGEDGPAIGKVAPLSNYVLVRLTEPEAETQGGILLPSKQQQSSDGDVVAVGPGKKRKLTGEVTPVAVAVGQKVLYRPNAYFEKFDVEGVEHGLLKEEDLVAIGEPSGEITPLRDYVLLRLGEPETETQGGIALPSRQKADEGVVVAVGPGKVRHERTGEVTPVGVAAGQQVMYRPGANFEELEVGGISHALLSEDDLVLSFDAPGSGAGPPAAGDASLAATRGRALVRVDPQSQETDQGLVLSRGAADGEGGPVTLGVVAAVGEGGPSGEEPDFAPGDQVYFRYGDELKLRPAEGQARGVKYMSVRLSDCLAKVPVQA